MEEIEVGEYVRTKRGEICKVLGIRPEIREGKRIYGHKSYYLDSKKGTLTEAFIVKHSKNIIDLIEVGDIVNYTFWEELDDFTIFCEMIRDVQQLLDFKFDIKENNITLNSILTKKQFNSIAYRLEE